MMIGPNANATPARTNDQTANDGIHHMLLSRLRFLAEALDLPFLQDGEIAIGNRENETADAGCVQLTFFAADVTMRLGAVVVPATAFRSPSTQVETP